MAAKMRGIITRTRVWLEFCGCLDVHVVTVALSGRRTVVFNVSH